MDLLCCVWHLENYYLEGVCNASCVGVLFQSLFCCYCVYLWPNASGNFSHGGVFPSVLPSVTYLVRGHSILSVHEQCILVLSIAS